MKEKNVKQSNPKTPSYQDFEVKSSEKPTLAKRKKNSVIEDELADDFGEVLGDGFHGLDDDYYFDEEDLY